MPPIEARYYPPDARDEAARKIEELGDAERSERVKLIDTYWNYYNGKHHKPLTVRSGKRDDNVIINLCAQAIDKEIACFAPTAPKLLLPGETAAPGDESPEQQALDGFWETNRLEDFLVNLALAGFVSGHAWVKLYQDREGDEPRVAVLDTRHVTAYWDRGDVTKPLWYRIQWELDPETKRRQDIVPRWLLSASSRGQTAQASPEEEISWTVIEYEQQSRRMGGRWQEIGRDEWAYPFAPLLGWKNYPDPHSFYGPSDLRHYPINDALNFVLSNTLRIIKYHAHPRTFIVGANLGELKETTIEGVWELPPGAMVNNLEMQSDLAASLQMIETLRSSFFTLMRVVDWASQRDKVGQITNFGLRVLFDDQLDLTVLKQRLYGRGITLLSQRAMAVMGHEVEEPSAEWADPLPHSHKEMVEAAVLEKTKLGFTSDRTLATELGRNYDEEQRRREQEAQSATEVMDNMLYKASRTGALGALFEQQGGGDQSSALKNALDRTGNK